MSIAPAPRTTQRYPKLTESEVISIIAALEEGAHASHLAKVYDVSARLMRAIKFRKAWDYLPRTQDFGQPRSAKRVSWDKATCERIWKAYYEQGQSSRHIADEEGISCNIVRQMLAGKSHRAMTAHLSRAVAPERMVTKDGAAVDAADMSDCAFCATPFERSTASRRKTCSDACLTRLRRRPVSSHDEPAVRVV